MGNITYIEKLRNLLDGKPNYQKFRYILDLGHDVNFIKEVFPHDFYRFEDLKFGPHRVVPNGVAAYLEFDNGHFASVVGGTGLYGDGKTSFELGFLIDGGIDVMGWLSPEQVTDEMILIQAKDPEPLNQNKDESN
ncbi:MAG: hypothetical protein GTO02_14845 [Candidatus Dadabacteria bacterium]|nr:hypothetical protein [Candidatus Dadabacteria bacterium]NIQ15619.1 hypothetical protein [Candidatus Dadabacteria bacterium]